jgi:pantothenate kinase type III
MSQTKFVYLRNKRKNITIAYKFDDEKGQIVFNSAQCNKLDTFVKAAGRHIAAARLENNRKETPNRTASYKEIGSDRYVAIANYLRNNV